MIVNICMQQNCSSLAFFSLQLMSKETTSPFAAELSGDLEQQVSIVATFMETQNRQIEDKSSSMKQQLLSNTFSAAFLMAGPPSSVSFKWKMNHFTHVANQVMFRKGIKGWKCRAALWHSG